MPPTSTQPSQVPKMTANDWGNPTAIATWKDAVMRYEPYYAKNPSQVDDFINQNVAQYKNTIGGQAVYNAQGGVTTGQAEANPQAAGQFIIGGGNLINTGTDAQALIINKAGQYFKTHTDKQGNVSPKDYNDFLNQYAQADGNSDAFHKKFQDAYVDPNNAMYNTPDSKMARGAFPIIKDVLDSYYKLKLTGPIAEDLGNIPVVGKYLKQSALLKADTAHNQFLISEVGNIRQIAGAGPNQGFRFNLNELNNIVGLLPGAFDTKGYANQKLDNLNALLKDKFGTNLKSVVKGNYGQ